MRYLSFFAYFAAAICLLSLASCRYQTIKTYSDAGDLQEKYKVMRRTKQMHGLYEFYFINKQVAIRRYFKKGIGTGEELLFHPNGQLEKRAQLVDGLHEGDFVFYFADGKLHQEGTHKNDLIQGKLKTYYPTGELKEIVEFDKGDENGEIIEYYRNGKIKSEGRLIGGDNRDGLYKIYSEEGELIQKQQCDRGKCITIWTIGDK
jgi:uncharacterized protein